MSKSDEDWLRRVGKRCGFVVRKTRRRNKSAPDYGTFSVLYRNEILPEMDRVSFEDAMALLTDVRDSRERFG